MKVQPDYRPLGCGECLKGAGLGFDFTMAFQPIVNATTGRIFAHEALARGLGNEPAGSVFQHVNDDNRYRFDQSCRTKAIKLAAEKGLGDALLSINFMPNAVYRPELCIRTTLAAAEAYGVPLECIIFEFTEQEQVIDIGHLRSIVDYYRERGFRTALDDFGAGYSGLNLLAEIRTDIVKLDMELIRHLDTRPARRAIVKGVIEICRELSTTVIAEGVETYEEFATLKDMGVELFQGYYFARPAFEAFATVDSTRFEPPGGD